MSATLFDDVKFKNILVSLLINDRQFLRTCRHLLTAKDFKPRSDQREESGHARYVLAQIALAYHAKWSEPVGEMISAEILSFCKKNSILSSKDKLVALAEELLSKKVKSVGAVIEKLTDYKKQVTKANAVSELIELQSAGKLDDNKWLEICRRGIAVFHKDPYESTNYFKELQQRIDRRMLRRESRFPVFFIDPLDVKIRSISRGHIGLLLAPYKGGKSLGLIHLAVSHCIQRYNVLYITLEDPKEDVEDRFDAQITQLPIKRLNARRKIFRERFKRFRTVVKGRLRIVDATEGGMTVPVVESIFDEHRNRGFTPDVVIIDYDDELRSTTKHDERRMEFADIYRDLRQFAAKKDVIVWTAAQTKRGTAGMKIIGGDDIAEDVSKIRKVSLAIGIGKGEWGDGSIYLNVAAHKLDQQHVGCNIMMNKERMIFYDRRKTLLLDKKHKAQEAEGVADYEEETEADG